MLYNLDIKKIIGKNNCLIYFYIWFNTWRSNLMFFIRNRMNIRCLELISHHDLMTSLIDVMVCAYLNG